MSGDELRVMIERGRSNITSVFNASAASSRSHPSSKASRAKAS